MVYISFTLPLAHSTLLCSSPLGDVDRDVCSPPKDHLPFLCPFFILPRSPRLTLLSFPVALACSSGSGCLHPLFSFWVEGGGKRDVVALTLCSLRTTGRTLARPSILSAGQWTNRSGMALSADLLSRICLDLLSDLLPDFL